MSSTLIGSSVLPARYARKSADIAAIFHSTEEVTTTRDTRTAANDISNVVTRSTTVTTTTRLDASLEQLDIVPMTECSKSFLDTTINELSEQFSLDFTSELSEHAASLSATTPSHFDAISTRSDASGATSISPTPPPTTRRSSARTRKTVALGGKTYKIVHPELLDAVFDWMAERHRMFERRLAGKPAPWTKNPTLAKWSFVNVYRVLDRTTQYLVDTVLNRGGSQDHEEACFRVMLFRAFNRISTWELLVKKLGPVLSWKTFDRKKYERVLRDATNGKMSLCTAAYMSISGNKVYSENFRNHLDAVVKMMKDGAPAKLLKLVSLQEAFDLLHRYSGMGSFLAFQLAVDLNMCPLLNWSEDEWAQPGPGAHSCLQKIFGRDIGSAQTPAMLWLRDVQKEHWERIGYTPRLPADGAASGVTVVDIEHALCEVDKYSRKVFPHIKSNKKHMRNIYPGASGNPLPVTVHMPLSWANRLGGPSDGTASTTCSRAERLGVGSSDNGDDDAVVQDNLFDGSIDRMDVDTPEPDVPEEDSGLTNLDDTDPSEGDGDTYEVEHIVAEMPDPCTRNAMQYLVRWVGYGPEDDYWMPESTLQDCPDVLARWRARSPPKKSKAVGKKAASHGKTRSSMASKLRKPSRL